MSIKAVYKASPTSDSLSAARTAKYNRSVKVSEAGEFELIDKLASILKQGQKADPKLLVGIGDDCAAWRVGDQVLLATTDTMVAGVHFLPSAQLRDVGWKIVAVNVSDITAMGGIPNYGLITLGLPPGTPVGSVEELYEGINGACNAYNIVIAGGDVVRVEQFFVTLALTGEATVGESGQPALMTRAAAKPGDEIAITGYLGDSAAGLRVLAQGAPVGTNATLLIQAHVQPQPKVEAGQAAVKAGVRCGIDISDGLLQDVGRICRASNVGALLYADKIPLSPALKQTFPKDAIALATSGGEDYELALVAPHAVLEQLSNSAEIPITIVGKVVSEHPGKVRLLSADGRELDIALHGWDHLRQA